MTFGRTVFCALSLTLVSIPLAARAADCAPPNWAPAAMLGYKIDSCDDKAWGTLDLPLGDQSKTVAGRRVRLNYQLTEDSKNATAAAVRDFYVNQARRNGAILMSPPSGSSAALTKTTPDGEFWYVYKQSSGNEESTGSYTLTTLRITPLQQEVTAKSMTAPLDVVSPTCQDPPWLLRQFAYFRHTQCEKKIWDSVSMDLLDGTHTLEGRRLTVNYELTDQTKEPAALAVARNYVNALQAIGATLKTDPNGLSQPPIFPSTLVQRPSKSLTSILGAVLDRRRDGTANWASTRQRSDKSTSPLPNAHSSV